MKKNLLHTLASTLLNTLENSLSRSQMVGRSRVEDNIALSSLLLDQVAVLQVTNNSLDAYLPISLSIISIDIYMLDHTICLEFLCGRLATHQRHNLI